MSTSISRRFQTKSLVATCGSNQVDIPPIITCCLRITRSSLAVLARRYLQDDTSTKKDRSSGSPQASANDDAGSFPKAPTLIEESPKVALSVPLMDTVRGWHPPILVGISFPLATLLLAIVSHLFWSRFVDWSRNRHVYACGIRGPLSWAFGSAAVHCSTCPYSPHQPMCREHLSDRESCGISAQATQGG